VSTVPATEGSRRILSSWGAPALVGLLWLTLIQHLRTEWSLNAQYSYGWGVPWLALYLFWKRWPDRPAPSPPDTITPTLLAAGFLLALILPARLLLESNPDWRLVSWTLGLLVVSLTFLLLFHMAGPSWPRHFGVPVAFILLSIPWPTPLEMELIQALMRSVAAATVDCANWIGVPARQHGNLIEMPSATVGVDEACSGVRSFQSTLMASVFLGELYRFSPLRRAAVVVGGVGLALLLNVGRTLLLTLAMYHRGESALDALHDPAGYAVLLIAFAFLWGGCALLNRKSVTSPAPVPEAPAHSPRPLPTAALLAFAGWLGVVEIANELWFRWHERSARLNVSWTVDWPAEGDGFKEQPIAADVRTILRYDEGRSGLFLNDNGSQSLVFFFRWNPGRSAAQSARIHSPDLCLPAAGLSQAAPPGQWSAEKDGLRLPFRTYVYDGGGRRWFVFYLLWEDRPGEPSRGAEDFSRGSRLRAVLEGRRHLGQQVLEIAVTGMRDAGVAQREVERYVQRRLRLSRNSP
jgi:exosortase